MIDSRGIFKLSMVWLTLFPNHVPLGTIPLNLSKGVWVMRELTVLSLHASEWLQGHNLND